MNAYRASVPVQLPRSPCSLGVLLPPSSAGPYLLALLVGHPPTWRDLGLAQVGQL